MNFQGETIKVSVDNDQIATLLFDSDANSVNKFDDKTIDELRQSVLMLQNAQDIKGLILASGKDTFIVGADITQFHQLFDHPQEKIEAQVLSFNEPFNLLEDLPFPTVCLLDGVALGGGLELALAVDFRLATSSAKVGLPEVKLGINPGFGGTVRLPRLIGLDNAIEWIATGKEYTAQAALDVGLLAGVVDKAHLTESAKRLIGDTHKGKWSLKSLRSEKKTKVLVNDFERLMCFTTAKGMVAQQAGPHMPAPITSVKSIEKSCVLPREEAIKVEAGNFAKLAKTEVCGHLVALFLNEQSLGKRNKTLAESVPVLDHLTVLGAGIMGGGIAYQAASKGKSVIMKDVAEQGLDQGMEEATQLLNKRVERGRLSALQMAETVRRITPQLDYAHVNQTDLVVEAVVEKLEIKQKVLSEVESLIASDAVLTSNTSTLSISKMAEGLKRPENFCGMHFFNPVHRMPLVEVIRGEKTSDEAIRKTVKLALDMGKTPIVVNDCAGFYVNRVLFPYLNSFNLLVRDGADFKHVDKVMEAFGWPMGPALLIDVVGIDTGIHAANVMADAFPDRMDKPAGSAMQLLFDNDRLGQKNNQGFYSYSPDKKGKLKKHGDPLVYQLLKPAVLNQVPISDEEILERLMLPLCFEVVRCLDEGIVGNPVDADMGLLMGIGFPLFRGGPLRYMESQGLQALLETAKKYQHLGGAFNPPASLVERVNNNRGFFEGVH